MAVARFPRRPEHQCSQSQGAKPFRLLKLALRHGELLKALATTSERCPAVMRVAGVSSINWQLHKP